MGWTSEMVAQAYKVSRERQDSVAFSSNVKASLVSGHLAYQYPYKLRNFLDAHRLSLMGDSQTKLFLSTFEALSSRKMTL